MKHPALPVLNVQLIRGKRVFLRADLNVPIHNGVIQDDSRLHALLPTLTFLKENDAIIILATHIGRPKNKEPELSTHCLIDWYSTQGFTFTFHEDVFTPLADANTNYLLENLRFFPGEKSQNDRSYIQALARMADVYIYDAFGMLHRDDVSVCALLQQFTPTNCAFGFLVRDEVSHLTRLTENITHPFAMILGGKKVTDKLALLLNICKKAEAECPDTILLGGLMALPFSRPDLSDEPSVACATQIRDQVNKRGIRLLVPDDYLVTHGRTLKINELSTDQLPLDIGPLTAGTFSAVIKHARTLFMNGTMGKHEDRNGAQGTLAVLQAIKQSNGYCVIAGGDTLSAASQLDVCSGISHCSTGGGAALAFLAAKNPYEELPGLKYLMDT